MSKARKPRKTQQLKGRTFKTQPRVLSFPLEQPVPVRYTVVGTPDWLSSLIPSEVDQHAVFTPGDLNSVFAWLEAQKRLGVDTESTGPRENDGLDPISPSSRLLLAQIGTADQVYLIEPRLLAEEARFKALLERKDILFLLQHAVHDFKFLLAKYGIHLMQIYDTMLAEQVLTAGKEGVKVGLAELARKYPPYRYIRKDVRNEFIGHQGAFTTRQLYYSARDVALLFPIADGQIQRMADLDLKRIARDEFDCVPATAEMELTGLNVDTERLTLTMNYFKRLMAVAERRALQIYNAELRRRGLAERDLLGEVWEVFDLQSPAQKMAALERLGISVPDVQRSTLMTVQHPLCKEMADFMEYQKQVSTYGEGMLKRIHWFTGRVHPRFNQHGAGEGEAGDEDRNRKDTIATGRYSGNMQQLPRPERIYDEIADAVELAAVRSLWPERFAA